MTTGKSAGAHEAVGCSVSAIAVVDGDGEQTEVAGVLQRVGDRPLGHPLHFLQLRRGHEAAGEGEIAQDDLRHDRGHPERRQFRGRLHDVQVVLGGADEPGRGAAKGMRQSGSLRHSGERHA